MGGSTAAGHGAATNVSVRIRRADALLLVALAFLWGSAYIAIREGLLAGASPFVFAGARYAIVAALLALAATLSRAPRPSRRGLFLSATVGGFLIIGFYGMFLYWGEQFTTGGYASVLAGTGPILTVVFAYSLLPAERLSRWAIVGVAIGFLGILVLVLPSLGGSAGQSWLGPVAIVAAFVVFALGTVLLRRWSREREGLWQLSVQFAVGSMVLGVLILAIPGSARLPFTFAVGVSLLVLVVFASLLGYVTYFRLHHSIGPGRANLVAYLLPLVGVGLGSGFFGEPITIWEVAGFGLVATGLSLVFATQGRSSSTSRTA